MLKTLFTGSGVALATPFTEDASAIDYDTFGEMIDWHIESGTDALIVFGTTGEPSTLTSDERAEGVRFAVKRAAGRIPVIAGSGGNDTRRTIEQAKRMQDLGADGLLVVTPYYNKTSQRGLIEHYVDVADQVRVPIILYNVPSRTGLNLEPETAEALSAHENIWGLKEASGKIEQIVEVARLLEGKMALYSGNDDQVLPILALGGLGVISVAANIAPKQMHAMTQAYFDGDIEKSRSIQFELLPLIQALFLEVNPMPLKEAMRLMGMGSGAVRKPLTRISQAHLERLEREIDLINSEFGVRNSELEDRG